MDIVDINVIKEMMDLSPCFILVSAGRIKVQRF